MTRARDQIRRRTGDKRRSVTLRFAKLDMLFALSSVILLSLPASPKELVGRAEKGASEYSLAFGPQRTPINGSCIFWGGEVASGEFFHDLKRTGSGTDLKFYKNNTRVLDYPQELHIKLRFTMHKCNARGVPDLGSSEIPDEFVSSLKFKANWKAGVRLRPAKGLVLQGYKHEPSEFTLGGHQISSDLVQYKMSLSAKTIPLTDHLILLVFSSEDKELVRLSAAP
jgi:hypothetical protein